MVMKRILVILFAVALVLSANAQDDCMNPDVNCDGYVNVNDLLGLLGYFGDEDLDGDGIWDSEDDCVEDECGICDGPGPQVLAVDTITFTTDSTFIEVINEWYVFEIPDTTFTFVCANPGCTNPISENYDPYASEDDGSCIGALNSCSDGSTSILFDGYSYTLVAIGDQCWFAENLRTEHYANGDIIPGELSNSQWSNTTVGAQAIYNDDVTNLDDYGRLYNWYAVNDSRGLCPSNWHVPTDAEFMTLETALGMSESELYEIGFRGTDQGTQMKSSPEDLPPWDGTNTSGFSALAAGIRGMYGNFTGFVDYVEPFCTYWLMMGDGPVPPNPNAYWCRIMEADDEQIIRTSNQMKIGASVRCVQD